MMREIHLTLFAKKNIIYGMEVIVMGYISAQEAAERWGITKRRVQVLCSTNRIDNAVRIGNMWVIPESAEKPSDSRLKCKTEQKKTASKSPIRLARNKIKSITLPAMQYLLSIGFSSEDAKKALITKFGVELLVYYLSDSTQIAKDTIRVNAQNIISQITHCGINAFDALTLSNSDIQEFINEYPFCCDDALSWCYQYANKIVDESNYSHTQFFTEKYMITSLVDNIDIKSKSKIFDPACGGANFLLYCLDVLTEDLIFKGDETTVRNEVIEFLNKLYGYEIDPILAMVASINLRLKCISILSILGYSVDISDFSYFVPNIYFPDSDTIAGALAINKEQQLIIKIGETSPVEISDAFHDIEIIVTNPPFQTIKGMPDNLKNFLKIEYPLSKCDMCNAFIEMSHDVLVAGGVAGIVTQNSWMYLDSFENLRRKLLSFCEIQNVYELGSNAFYDLNGEKSNVALLLFSKKNPAKDHAVHLVSLKTLELAQKETLLTTQSSLEQYLQKIFQRDILANVESRFDMISSAKLRELLFTHERYETYAVPMQGTSTGASKELIDYYWNHIGDSDWTPVSKGGGYSRWQGLNHYCVKWGKNGEYIKAQKGSAIRNANYFDQTQLVFSDTGTSGLNVRELRDGQIFVASGPGIRIKSGRQYAHLAFLNSRVSSYYIRLLSPKLTIAAGYIAKIPVCSELVESSLLDEYGRQCLYAKKRRLSKRPFNMEFTNCGFNDNVSFEDLAHMWFIQDIEDEWTQLQNENLIDEYICSVFGLSTHDLSIIDEYIGTKLITAKTTDEPIEESQLEAALQNALDYNCNISRTKSSKKSLGCDGIVEYLSQKTNYSCESIVDYIRVNDFYPQFVKERYENLLLHAIIISTLGYTNNSSKISVSQVIIDAKIEKHMDLTQFQKWIGDEFNKVHTEAFLKSPIYVFDSLSDEFVNVKEK